MSHMMNNIHIIQIRWKDSRHDELLSTCQFGQAIFHSNDVTGKEGRGGDAWLWKSRTFTLTGLLHDVHLRESCLLHLTQPLYPPGTSCQEQLFFKFTSCPAARLPHCACLWLDYYTRLRKSNSAIPCRIQCFAMHSQLQRLLSHPPSVFS